jgi:hypothetical protein
MTIRTDKTYHVNIWNVSKNFIEDKENIAIRRTLIIKSSNMEKRRAYVLFLGSISLVERFSVIRK